MVSEGSTPHCGEMETKHGSGLLRPIQNHHLGTVIWSPLDYEYPDFDMQLGQMIGLVDKVDWEPDLPRNIHFMRVRVQIDPWLPLFVGFMINLDDGTKQWIQCRYERVLKVCTRCGLSPQTNAMPNLPRRD